VRHAIAIGFADIKLVRHAIAIGFGATITKLQWILTEIIEFNFFVKQIL
jgi:hypothetical protein